VSVKSGPDQCSQKCRRYARTASGLPSISSSDSGSRWNAWYQNSRSGPGPKTRVPTPGTGGLITRPLTRSGRDRARACAIRLPMSYPTTTAREMLSEVSRSATLRACAGPLYCSAGSATCLSEYPNPRRSGTTTSHPDSSGTRSR
jgi:hypothetical protein